MQERSPRNRSMNELFAAFSSPDLEVRHGAEVQIAVLIQNNPSIAKEVISGIRTGNSDTRWYLSRTLIKAGDMVIPLIIAESKREMDPVVQRYYGSILASFGEKSVPYLIDLFSSENALARGMAGAALEKIGDASLNPLLNATKSDDATVRSCAGIVLMKLGVYQY